MDARIIFWSAALVNMWVVVGLGLSALSRARKDDMKGFEGRIAAGGILVVLFVVAYAVKLMVLGREDLDTWAMSWVILLRVHEVFIIVMLGAGVRAGLLRRRLSRLGQTGDSGEDSRSRLMTSYRQSGKLAVLGAGLGALTATVTLVGMFARLHGG